MSEALLCLSRAMSCITTGSRCQRSCCQQPNANRARPTGSPPRCGCSTQRVSYTKLIQARAGCRMAQQVWIKGREIAYPTWRISKPFLTSSGRSFTSFRFCAGSSTVLTPARSAPISFSLIPPTAVTRPRREISPCITCRVSMSIPERNISLPDVPSLPWSVGPACQRTGKSERWPGQYRCWGHLSVSPLTGSEREYSAPS